MINMNGRLYDPVMARMLSPDNHVQDPENTQNYNRYSYCMNNPLKYVDPTGEKLVNAHEKKRNEAQQAMEEAKAALDAFEGNTGADGYKEAYQAYKRSQRKYNNINEKYEASQLAMADLSKYNSDLYKALDNLTDERGNTVDVYVQTTDRIRDEYGNSVSGLTATRNVNEMFVSKYGVNTILIEIDSRIKDKGLILSHEGGHTVYNVSNWSNYLDFYKKYTGPPSDRGRGHEPTNPSGRRADRETDIL